eukprot:TRINITY_DN26173_c2_g2_i1.p1 TRINITY_DN26173_c2_g2~~TRINITY_DN26173_c2_g2_i1.p1  ORF type:complete len:376 (+),score=80.26 TRINITY_DN26173_c2_g2_i1:99-1226(+)
MRVVQSALGAIGGRRTSQTQRCDGHDPLKWLESFAQAGDGTDMPDMRIIRQMRVDIWHQTEDAIIRGRYKVSKLKKVVELQLPEPLSEEFTLNDLYADPPPNVRATSSSSSPYPAAATTAAAEIEQQPAAPLGQSLVPNSGQAPAQLRVEVRAEDMLRAARQLFDEGHKVAVLNMACATSPGGGFRNGAGAQEETLHRRTDLYRYLEMQAQRYYPLHGALASHDVTVFRDTEKTGYSFLPEPFRVNVVSCAAHCHPHLLWHTDPTKEPRLSPYDADALEAKIRAILRAAHHTGSTAVVLSAFGCGAFCNPPTHVAELFKKVLLEPLFMGKFEHIVFSILEDHNSKKSHNPNGNFQPFKAVFREFATPLGSLERTV